MAEPINHNMSSAGLQAAKSGAWGMLGGVVATGLLIGGGLVLGAGTVGGFLGSVGVEGAGFGTYAAAMLTGAGAWATGVAATLGALTFGATGAVIGGLLGAIKGGSRASSESREYQAQMQEHLNPRAFKKTKEINDAEIRGMQQGYMMGAQEREQQIVSQLQQVAMQQQAMQPQTQTAVAVDSAKGATALAAATAEASCDCGPHTKKIQDRREAAAAAGTQPQVGA